MKEGSSGAKRPDVIVLQECLKGVQMRYAGYTTLRIVNKETDLLRGLEI